MFSVVHYINVSLLISSLLLFVHSLIHSHLHLQWDEGLLIMSKGETARLEIESDWAYGKKGLPDSKYPFIALKYCIEHTLLNLPILKAVPILLLAQVKFIGCINGGLQHDCRL